jgi:hypothetical protein
MHRTAKESGMIIKNGIDDVLHRIRIKLYRNFIQKIPGAYIARTNNEASLTIEQVCGILKNRGGFSGSYDDLIANIHKYYEEVAYQLCDGYAVNNGYYTVYPNIGGTFNSAKETHDHKLHPISFRFAMRAKLRRLIRGIIVDVDGVADTACYIATFTDYEENSANAYFLPGNQFSIQGHQIKIAGDDPGNGVYFVPVDDPSKAVKVERLAKNSPSEVTGIAPNTNFTNNRIEIRTQFSSSKTLLKAPRSIVSTFTVEAA